MQESLDAMHLALRVLTALTEKRNPDPSDVEALRRAAGQGGEGLASDELACEVIQQALARRALARRRGAA